MKMKVQDENKIVIRSLVGKPVPWNGGLAEPDMKVLAILQKRTSPVAPINLARLTGVTRIQINEALLRLKRRGLAESVRHGQWVAA
jgi:hypothetical protein